MANDPKDFLSRWSRLKRERAAAGEAAAAAAAEPAPELPPLDQLTPESDFKAFMHAKVKDSVRRAALKKLFADPRFNIMDDLDIYIGDYREGEPIPPEMLAELEHSKSTLSGGREAPGAEKAPEPAPETVPDAARGAAATAPLEASGAEESSSEASSAEQAAPRADADPAMPAAKADERKDDGAAG
jgi:hypothetical protein